MNFGREMVTLLTDAATDNALTEQDEELACRAAEWLKRQGWQFHDRLGFVSNDVAFRADEEGDGLVVRRRQNRVWEAEGTIYPVESFAAALNQLAVLGITDGRRFSTFGRDALESLARVLEEAADDLEREARQATAREVLIEMVDSKAEGLREAAESARRLLMMRVPA